MIFRSWGAVRSLGPRVKRIPAQPQTVFGVAVNMVLSWLLSRTVRRAVDLRRHVRRLINEQRDLLSQEAIEAIESACETLRVKLTQAPNKAEIECEMERLITVADQWFIPHPNGAMRENIKELVVAATVIFGITTFLVQLTKIPTGSMQPTLYGITGRNLKSDPSFQMPGTLSRFVQFWTKGISYFQVTAKSDGRIERIDPPKVLFPFVKVQRLLVGKEWYSVWFPPEKLEERAHIRTGDEFRKGEDIIRLKVVSGDHLLVDRFTYNFRRPQRGEIIVFKTKGISELLAQDQLYIKRLVAFGGEKVRIGNDQHLIIDGQRLDAATPNFENVYTFSYIPRENQYFGHVNQSVANRFNLNLAPLFSDERQEQTVRPGQLLAMGDNTLNSSDGRYWGDLPRQNVIGKCWFVYWPFTERFGWGNR